MATKLYDNAYGYSVAHNNPFFIFPYLQEIVQEKFRPDQVLDLSRGDPGLGFCPSARSRKFYAFLATIDTELNSNFTGFRIHLATEKDLPKIEKLIAKAAKENFPPKVAREHLKTLDFVVKQIQKYAKQEGKKLTRLEVLNGMLHHSALLGGTYHTPRGEPLVKIVVAGMYREILKAPELTSDDFIFTLGVNDGIGTLFQMLGEEGLGYLKKGDAVAASTPAYAPYFNEINKRGFTTIEVPTMPGGDAEFKKLANFKGKIKAFFLISPNNPTGVRYTRAQTKRIAELAEKHDALIITDEIYAQFYSDCDSIWKLAKKRTIRLCGRSKIERSPGLRFGDVLISRETNEYLTKSLLKNYLKAPDFKTEFVWAKAPGGMFASFQHTAAVPGPSQIVGMLHILLGAEERKKYLKMVDQNMEAFFKGLGIPRQNMTYYGIFDLNKIPGCKKQNVGIDQKLYDLTMKHGVILIPALKFFSDAEQLESDKTNYVRASLPNLTLIQTKEAAKRIRNYLCA